MTATGAAYAPPPMLTLAHETYWISPYVFTCFVALREKGLDFTAREVPLQDGAQRRPEFARASVTARIPSLEHDGFVVAESTAIVEYLEDAFPNTPRVLPTDPRRRARARQVLSWIRSDDTLPLREERPTSTMFYEHTRKPLSEKARASADKLVAIGERLLDEAEGASPFGDWCIADADLAFMLHRLVLNGDAVPARLRAWAEREWLRPSAQAFISRPRPAFVPY
ncbi:MAG: glutathione transferase [Polyangiales bacterium]